MSDLSVLGKLTAKKYRELEQEANFTGKDVLKWVACWVYDIPYENVTHQQRAQIKEATFVFRYGRG